MKQRSALAILGAAGLLVSFLLSFGLSSCGRDQHGPVLVGTNVWLGYEPLFMARDLGFFPDQEVRLLEFTSNTDSIHALRQGTLDAAALTLDEALLLARDNIDFQVVLVMDFSHGADVILAQPEITDFRDLKGRKIGVENTAVGAYMLVRALETHGLSATDITPVPLEVFEHEKAFAAGSVDAVVTFEPVRSKLLAKGAQQLFDSSKIPHEIVDVLIVRRDSLEQHRAHLKDLVKGWFSALDYLEKNQADAVQRMTGRLAIEPEEITTALAGLRFPGLDENRRLLQSRSSQLAASGDKLVQIMVRNGLLKKEVNIRPLLSTDLLGDL